MVRSAAATNELRERYRPRVVRVLFVGEAPPAAGTFFYEGNSQVYRYIKDALHSHFGNPSDFLKSFAERGYFLDDLVLTPVDGIPLKDRRSIYQKTRRFLLSVFWH